MFVQNRNAILKVVSHHFIKLILGCLLRFPMSQFWPLLDESVEVVTPGVGGTCSRLLPAVEEDMVIE
jgi:hypothetical protein